jgi:hypothetical protein
MSKSKENKTKNSKKVAVRTLKEKRADKVSKRKEKNTESKIAF